MHAPARPRSAIARCLAPSPFIVLTGHIVHHIELQDLGGAKTLAGERRPRIFNTIRKGASLPSAACRPFWVLGEEPPQGRVRKTFVFSSRRVPVPIVFGVGSLVSPLVDATPYPLTFVFFSCVVRILRPALVSFFLCQVFCSVPPASGLPIAKMTARVAFIDCRNVNKWRFTRALASTSSTLYSTLLDAILDAILDA